MAPFLQGIPQAKGHIHNKSVGYDIGNIFMALKVEHRCDLCLSLPELSHYHDWNRNLYQDGLLKYAGTGVLNAHIYFTQLSRPFILMLVWFLCDFGSKKRGTPRYLTLVMLGIPAI